MPRSQRVFSLSVTAAATAVCIATMTVAVNTAPSGANAASANHALSSGRSAHPTDAALALEPPVAEPYPRASTESATSVTPAPAGIRVAAVNIVTGSAPGSSGDVSPLAADGIPATALQAYQDAATALATADPGCGIQWPLLAGIGRVESDHGRFAGATLYTNGTSSARILGPVLDGNGTAAIRDTDGGALDGDGGYDRAMGPMQFIPSTWSRYASDGNGDGVDDPFNIFDETLAAAKYLCAAGGNLTTTTGQVRAVFAYNHLTSYVNTVLGLEHAYAAGAGVVVPDPPAAPNAGAVPVVVEPVVVAPVKATPVAAKPVKAKPVMVKPVTTKPVITKPVTAKPVTTTPVTPTPVTNPVTATPTLPVTSPTTPVVTTPTPVGGVPTIPPTTLTCPVGTQPIPVTSGAAGSGAVTGSEPVTPETTPAPTTDPGTTSAPGTGTDPGTLTDPETTGTPASGVTQLMPDGSPVPVGCMLDPVPVTTPTTTG